MHSHKVHIISYRNQYVRKTTVLTHRKSEQRCIQVVREHRVWEKRQQDGIEASKCERHVVHQDRIYGFVTGYPTTNHSPERVRQTSRGHQPHGHVFVHAHTDGFFCGKIVISRNQLIDTSR